MATSAQNDQSPFVVQATIGNPAFIDSLDRAVTAAVRRVYEVGQPTYLDGCAGNFMYYYSVDYAYQSLQGSGFIVKPEQKQLRVYAQDRYECPVWLRFGIGTTSGNTFCFHWPKGTATASGVLQNKRLLRTPVQGALFDDWDSFGAGDTALNLWVLYNISKDHLSASLGIGIEHISKHKIYCSLVTEICNKQLDADMSVDYYIGSDESDYNIDLGEKSAGE